MQLTKRLLEIASLVPPNTTVVDIGTDHGYIPIYLTRQHTGNKCIASDVNQGPLDSAKRHMDKYQVTGIELRRGSGLSTVTEEDHVDVAIVAGMGGLLIIDILKNDLKIVKGLNRLILQPQSNLPEVREYVHQIGFSICEERFLQDEGKYYTILVLEPGAQKYMHSYEYIYGKYLLQHPNETFRAWLQHKETVFNKIREQLEQTDAETREKRLQVLEAEIACYKEAIACIPLEK